MKGRKPMPVERAAKLGNPSRRPLPKATEVTLAVDTPTPPAFLQTAGKKLYTQVYQFASTWVKHELDETVLLIACEIADDRERLKRVLRKDGHFQKIPLSNSKGELIGEEIKIHPARRELQKQDAALIRALGILGLTPTDRSRLKLTEAQAENEIEKWIRESRQQ